MFIELQTTAFTRVIKVNKNTTFQLIGTIGASEITFEQPDGAGGWAQITIDAEDKVLSADNTILSFYCPALIRVNKPVTVATAGVMLVS